MSAPAPPQASDRAAAPFAFGARIALVYSALFFFTGLQLPFFPLWLEARGLSPTEISVVLALPLVLRVLASAQLAARADRARERADLVIALYALSALAALAYLVAGGFWAILLVTALFAFFNNPIVPIIDSLTLSGVRRYGIDYGRVRLWGSLVFIVANLGGGALLAGYDVETLLAVLIGAVVAGALLAPLLPRIGPPRRPREAVLLGSPWRLMAGRRFLLVIVASGLVQASHALIYGFGSIHWQKAGLSGTQIGALWATGVMAEVVLFHFSRRLMGRLGAVNLLVAGAAGATLRWALMPAEPGLAGLFVLQAMHGLSFGATHLGTMHFLAESVGEERLGAAQGAAFVVGGAAMAVAVFAAGPLYGALGAWGFLVMAAVAAAGLALVALASRSQPHSAGRGGETSEAE